MTEPAHKYVLSIQQLTTTISLYESYLTKQQTQQVITEEQQQQKGDKFLEYVNDLLFSKIKTINQIVQRSIELFQNVIKQENQMQIKIVDLEHLSEDRKIQIQNYKYNMVGLQDRIASRDEQMIKCKNEIMLLNEKLDSQQFKYKRQTKQLKKTFRDYQKITESDKKIMSSIQFDYEHEKQQNEILQQQLLFAQQQVKRQQQHSQQIRRLHKASQNKLQWEVKKKIPLQDTIKDQKQLIDRLLIEIQDLKQTIKNPYERLDRQNLQQYNQKEVQFISMPTKSFEKHKLCDQIPNKQSIDSTWNLQQYVRRHSMRRSFDQNSMGGPSQTNLSSLLTPVSKKQSQSTKQPTPKSILIKDLQKEPKVQPYTNNQKSENYLQKVDSHISNSSNNSNNNEAQHQQNENKTSQFEQSQNENDNENQNNRKQKPEYQSKTQNQIVQKTKYYDRQQYNGNSSPGIKVLNPKNVLNSNNQSHNSINRNSHVSHNSQISSLLSQEKHQQQSSINNNHLNNNLDIISQRVSVDQRSNSMNCHFSQTTSFQIKKFTPDLYYAHFLLTSQSIKMQEDNEQMFCIDVKPLYKEVIEKGIPMHKWGQFLRQNMLRMVDGQSDGSGYDMKHGTKGHLSENKRGGKNGHRRVQSTQA